MSTPINAADPASKVIYTFTDVGALHNAIQTYHYIPVKPDGSPFEVQWLAEYGGYVLDGAPINVWMDGYWLDGQKEAMQPYWTAGTIRQPPANIMNAPVQPMPADLAARTAAYKAGNSGFFGMDTGTLAALGAGILAVIWIARR